MKPTIPQFEFSFAGSAFNLAGQAEKPAIAQPARILAEMTPDERETVRANSKAHKADATRILESCHAGAVRSGLKGGELIGDVFVRLGLIQPQTEVVKLAIAQWEREVGEYSKLPGLAPGSFWSKPDSGMRKALSTMQGGAR